MTTSLNSSPINSLFDTYDELASTLINHGINIVKIMSSMHVDAPRAVLKEEITKQLDDKIDELLIRDRYLELAHAMQHAVIEPIKGISAVQEALDNFMQASYNNKNFQCKQNIINELSKLISAWAGDGRVFRNCAYNYLHLYTLATPSAYRELVTLTNLKESIKNI